MPIHILRLFRHKRNCGFSLVELLVSSAILALAIIAIVTLIRKGRELDTTDGHRRRARAVIDSCFELPAYSSHQYATMQNVANQTVVIEPAGYGRETDDLEGTLTITVSAENTHTEGTNTALYKSVTATVTWPEPENPATSISMTKWVSPIE